MISCSFSRSTWSVVFSKTAAWNILKEISRNICAGVSFLRHLLLIWYKWTKLWNFATSIIFRLSVNFKALLCHIKKTPWVELLSPNCYFYVQLSHSYKWVLIEFFILFCEYISNEILKKPVTIRVFKRPFVFEQKWKLIVRTITLKFSFIVKSTNKKFNTNVLLFLFFHSNYEKMKCEILFK